MCGNWCGRELVWPGGVEIKNWNYSNSECVLGAGCSGCVVCVLCVLCVCVCAHPPTNPPTNPPTHPPTHPPISISVAKLPKNPERRDHVEFEHLSSRSTFLQGPGNLQVLINVVAIIGELYW